MAFIAGIMLAPAFAAEVPAFDRDVRIDAREQPVGRFLGDLFGQLDVPVMVDPDIVGSVSGDFSKSAQAIFSDIANSFHLRLYFDGAIAHIYPSNQLVRTHINMSDGQAAQLVRTVNKLGLTDAYNRLVPSELGVMLTGTPRFVEQVDELTEAVRTKRPSTKAKPKLPVEESFKVFNLRYAWADDVTLNIGEERLVVPGIASILRSIVEPGEFAQPLEERIAANGSLEGLRGQGLQAASELGHTASGGSDTLSTRIVADPVSNSIIVRDREDRMASYESLIRQLDVRPKMVEIEATIIDLDTDRLRELGVNWRASDDDYEALLGSGTADDVSLFPAAPPTVDSSAGGVVSLVLGGERNFIARIRALEARGAARIVSKPHVLTLANVEALMDTTSTFFVRVAGNEEVDLFDITVGTTLRVTPHVHTDEQGEYQIKLRVTVEDGSQSSQRVDSIPVIERSTINTQAIIQRGQSLLIGGLVREFTNDGVSGVPGLNRLPVVGALFRSNMRSTGHVERMFLITPRLNSNALPEGLRYQGPINEGSELEIITSAPKRLQPTRDALALRDSVNPDPLPLPPEQRIPSIESQSGTAPAGTDEAGWQAVGREPATTGPGTAAAPVRQDATVPIAEPATAPTPEQPAPATPSETIDEGWIEVQNAPSVDELKPPSGASSGDSALANDGWQAIGQ